MTSGITFIHVSDIHIGVETHGKINPKTGRNSRLEDVLNSLDFIVDKAVDNGVDLVLIAGDIFHRENPNPTEETEFAKRIGRIISGRDTQVVIALGNHDYPTSSARAAAVEIFPALNLPGIHVVKRAEILNLDTKNGKIQLVCLPWVRASSLIAKEDFKAVHSDELQREIERRMLSIVQGLIQDTVKDAPAVFVGHLALRNAKLSGSETTSLDISDPSLSVGDLAVSELVYSALGHIHKFQDLNEGRHPPVVYAGSIERIDFSEEREKKGFVMGEIIKSAQGWRCEYEFVETPARKFFTVEIDASEEGIDEAAISEIAADEKYKDAIVRVRYKLPHPDSRIEESKIRQALGDASSVKIERVFEGARKTVRHTELTRKMDALEALEIYVGSKPELKNISEDMMEYAKKLLNEDTS